METLIRTKRRDVTVERGARFYPTIGSFTLMDLPLATPELDHDALRDNSFFRLSNSRDKGYSPPPTGYWQRVFLYQAGRHA
jgi:hypothetical protein